MEKIIYEKKTKVGFEYKSKLTIFGLPLIHIAFGKNNDNKLLIAKGVIAIGQFAIGILTISQFGLGMINISQFGIGIFTIAQFGISSWSISQFAINLFNGIGQFVFNIL